MPTYLYIQIFTGYSTAYNLGNSSSNIGEMIFSSPNIFSTELNNYSQ